jgi:hypothetical protein
MRIVRFLICGALALFASATLAHPKMTPELFRKFWTTYDSSVVKRVRLNNAKKAEIGKMLGSYPDTLNDVDVFVVSSKTSALGVLANLNVGATDIGVAMDRNRKKIVKVIFYTTGKDMTTLNTPTFLNQFAGKTGDQAFKVGQDIRSIKGAEKQAQNLATIVKGTVLFLQKGW